MPPSLSHISMCFLALSPATRTGLSGPSTYKGKSFQKSSMHHYSAIIQISFLKRRCKEFTVWYEQTFREYAYRLQLPTVVDKLTHPVLKIVSESFGVKHNKTMSLKWYFNLISIVYKHI